MKRVRLDAWACHIQPPRNPRLQTRCTIKTTNTRPLQSQQWRRGYATGRRKSSTQATTHPGVQGDDIAASSPIDAKPRVQRKPQPVRGHDNGNARIAKLSALHARLALPAKLPLHTLARCLIDASADVHPARNNASMAILGQDLLAYYTTEHLVVNYPRLPLAIMFSAQYAYTSAPVLSAIRKEWGVDLAAAPGIEVDKAFLQFKRVVPGKALAPDGVSQIQDHLRPQKPSMGMRSIPPEARRSMSSRVVYDDEFGDIQEHPHPSEKFRKMQQESVFDAADSTPDEADSTAVVKPKLKRQETALQQPAQDLSAPVTETQASAKFIRALAGALYLHAGDEAVKDFHREHILSRHLEMHKLFHFTAAPRDLSRLCSREGFEAPVARLLSETGRLSRTPVFVVGVFSGDDKLGEAAGASLNEARIRAACAALRAWYLYTPPVGSVMRPSDMLSGKKKWIPQVIDPGEIIS